jgi:hypothetical protein
VSQFTDLEAAALAFLDALPDSIHDPDDEFVFDRLASSVLSPEQELISFETLYETFEIEQCLDVDVLTLIESCKS